MVRHYPIFLHCQCLGRNARFYYLKNCSMSFSCVGMHQIAETETQSRMLHSMWGVHVIHHLSELVYMDDHCHPFYIVISFQNSNENFCELAQTCHIRAVPCHIDHNSCGFNDPCGFQPNPVHDFIHSRYSHKREHLGWWHVRIRIPKYASAHHPLDISIKKY